MEFEARQQAELRAEIAKVKALIGDALGPADGGEDSLKDWLSSMQAMQVRGGVVCLLEAAGRRLSGSMWAGTVVESGSCA